MAQFDFPLEQLQGYISEATAPHDFAAFWQETLMQTRMHPLEPRFAALETPLQTLEAFDVTFNGYAGQPIKGWLMLPKQRNASLPCIVEFVGYGGGRGLATDHLLWASCGFAHLVMDTRGQGSSWSCGDTPDLTPDGDNPQHPGFMTRGILHPETYYYRRVFIDAVRAIAAAKSHPAINPNRIAVIGGSQGGGIAIAAASLEPSVLAVAPDVPFLSDFARATQITNSDPYGEIVRYLKVQRGREAQVFGTLNYFDAQHFAASTTCAALYSVALMDEICPPSTVFAAYNRHAGTKQIVVYPYNNHEGGGAHHTKRKLEFMQMLW